MDKQLTRADRFLETVAVQAQHFVGKPGSPKQLASRIMSGLSEFSGPRPGMLSSRIEAEWRESSRQDMVKALQNCDSDFFRTITEVATALYNRDSLFFKRIAAGLDQLPRLDTIDLIKFIHLVYFSWMFPTSQMWFAVWTLPAYKNLVVITEPTKQQMRDLTERFWAIERLIQKKSIEFCLANEEQPQDVEDKITAEIATLPPQKWARHWKRAGLSHLKSGRAGRPKIKRA